MKHLESKTHWWKRISLSVVRFPPAAFFKAFKSYNSRKMSNFSPQKSTNKQHHRRVLPNNFHLNGCTLEFHSDSKARNSLYSIIQPVYRRLGHIRMVKLTFFIATQTQNLLALFTTQCGRETQRSFYSVAFIWMARSHQLSLGFKSSNTLHSMKLQHWRVKWSLQLECWYSRIPSEVLYLGRTERYFKPYRQSKQQCWRQNEKLIFNLYSKLQA